MIDSVGPTLSALTGFRKKLNATSNNIANVNTDEFKKTRVTFQEDQVGGIRPVIDQVDSPGHPKEILREGVPSMVESSNVDLAEELPELMTTKSAFGANLKSFKTGDEMIGSLLDILS